MSGNVLPLQQARRAAAKAAHPATVGKPPTRPTVEQRAVLLTAVARTWEPMTAWMLDQGQTSDQAELALLELVTPLVHAGSRDALGPFLMPELRRVVERLDLIRKGELHPADLDCASFDEAEGDAERDVDYELFQLLTGVQTRFACRGCRNLRPVWSWWVQGDCPDHAEVRL